MADFLVALADFDAHRGWEPLGHATLFAFLHEELGLSNSAAFHRMSAARLLQRFPEVLDPLRQGRLCLSTMAELAKVLTSENFAQVAPRFFGRSAREAQEVVAEIQPRHLPATRAVVTRVALELHADRDAPADGRRPVALAVVRVEGAPTPSATYPTVVPHSQLPTSEVANGGGQQPRPQRDNAEPLTADLRRLHVTVSRRFLRDLEAARDGLSHAIPNASTEQVLQAALDLLLEKQASARGQVKRPRKSIEPTQATAPVVVDPPHHRRAGPRAAIPAAVRRAVWARDGGRCSWPLDGGGTCGSTHRLELDHVVPWARGGEATVANLRVVCGRHNALAARASFGARVAGRYGSST